ERKASRWRKEPCVEAIEILEAWQVRCRCRARRTSWQAGSTARLSWQFDSHYFPMTIQKPFTLQEAKSIARHLRLTLRKQRSRDYCVNFCDGDESTDY